MSLFAVALKDHAAPPLAALPFLAGVKDFNRASAREVLRRQPGFLGRALSLEAAGELRASAAAAGFETMLVQEEEVPAPPPPLRTVKIELKGNGLYSTAAGAVEFIPYGEIQLLSAGAFDAPVPPVTMEALKDSLFLKIRASLPGGTTTTRSTISWKSSKAFRSATRSSSLTWPITFTSRPFVFAEEPGT